MLQEKVGAHIASHTPGRLRIRLDSRRRQKAALLRVRDHMQDQPGVVKVDANPTTGSVVVHYDQHGARRGDLLAALSDVGVILGDVAETVDGHSLPSEGPGRSTTAVSVVDSISDLDRRLSDLTGRKIDMKLLFPISLGVLGIRQVLTRGWGLTEVPAYVLLWYAFDSFWKFHREPPGAVMANLDGHETSVPEPTAVSSAR
ncbi:MAG: hypothetical protein NVSMB2_20580 [Chloroflexota bacterium]